MEQQLANIVVNSQKHFCKLLLRLGRQLRKKIYVPGIEKQSQSNILNVT
jgi:hypothetical protein